MEVFKAKAEERILGAMGLEKWDTVVIIMYDHVTEEGYDQKRTYGAVTTEYKIFSPSSDENMVLNLLINEHNYTCLIDTGAAFFLP